MSVTAVRGPVTFSPTYLVLELRRALRNRRTMIFLLIMPPVFFLLFGHGYKDSEPAAFAYVMVSMAVYGAMIATTSIGAQVSVERSQGWTRQLRLTSLRPTGYVLTKVGAALILGVVPILIVLGVGASMGAQLSAGEWISVAVLSWFCSLVFAAFGLFIGYLIPAENAMQFMGPVLALMSFFGGSSSLSTRCRRPCRTSRRGCRPTRWGWWPAARSRLRADRCARADLLLWTAVFVAGTAVLFRRDTKRV